MKALGTGVRGVGWREVEVVRRRGRAPAVQLHGGALERARAQGISRLAISLSHCRSYAVAFVIGEGADNKDEGPTILSLLS